MKLETNRYLDILDTLRDWLVKIYLHLATEIQLRKLSGKSILLDTMLNQKNVSCHKILWSIEQKNLEDSVSSIF
jgi:hypothetical protein